MFSDIQKEVSACSDRMQVFRIVQKVQEPLVILRVFESGNWTLGEFWIANGNTIVGAISQASKLEGNAALAELLTAVKLNYELVIPTVQPPAERTNVLIKELLDGDSKLIEMFKVAALMIPRPVGEPGPVQPALTADQIAAAAAAAAAAEAAKAAAAATKKSQQLILPERFEKDDLAPKRKADLESAAVNPPQVTAPPDELLDAPPTFARRPDLTPEQKAALLSAPEQQIAGKPVFDDGMPGQLFNMPNASHTNMRAYSAWKNSVRQPGSESGSGEPSLSIKAFTSVITHAEKEVIPQRAWVAITVPALTLPLMALVVVYVSMMESRLDTKAAELCNWQVNRALDDGEPAAYLRPHPMPENDKDVDIWQALNPTAMHSLTHAAPKADPGGEQKLTKSNGASAGPEDGKAPPVASGDAIVIVDEAHWHKPTTKPPKLSELQSNEVDQLMHVGDQLSTAGKLKEAAAAYSAALARYPGHNKLRAATIMAHMRIRKYVIAKTLCLDGLAAAMTYDDYLVFANFLRNLPKDD